VAAEAPGFVEEAGEAEGLVPPNTARGAALEAAEDVRCAAPVAGLLAPWPRVAVADVLAADLDAGLCACAPKPLTAMAANSTTLRASKGYDRLRRAFDMESGS